MNNLKDNLHKIRARISSACKKAGRDPQEIYVLAVSKRHPARTIQALSQLGQSSFGENYVQEALAKIKLLEPLNLEWHFIGPLQSNKTRQVAQHFQWVQSVDRLKTLRRLSDQRPDDLERLNVCIQVNIDREPQKGGVMPEQARKLAEAALNLPRTRLRGLMAIPRAGSDLHDPADSYQRMNVLFRSLRADGIEMDTLSMGMSADLEAAIMHGSTMVRIGTDLLGERPRNDKN
ncbi:MAG: YggS family pyridoxal phosphate-dependent enzyme [Xanthomonadales bacterium]|nr:YggS family pyridoxal phosphate-dependent enzyme [Gammaproteobacteria bacterium]MBT8055133.1 YggS family pyridoxal phosphate-dependent enzyme [Gammaproteobacteria bacterium]NND58378.1 YggS family pyridoxal phosphate-dependent enzyme [Xanthomonadales bacterium]NNK51727.1 YggS family pyridoxal phosphate-dependent enzyme [Xanthomonadales bacterium]